MLLRASGEHDNVDYDLAALKDGTGGGVEDGELLIRFVDTVMDLNAEAPAVDRAEIRDVLGEAALVDIAAVIATFEATDRIADATGTPLEDYKEAATVALRKEIGF